MKTIVLACAMAIASAGFAGAAQRNVIASPRGHGASTAGSVTYQNGSYPNGLIGTSSPGKGTATAGSIPRGHSPSAGQGVTNTPSPVTAPGFGTATHPK